MSKNAQLSLVQLSDRIVPAATLNLTAAGAEAVAGGAIVRQIDARPAGDLDTFVRLQDSTRYGGVQEGYNTDARPLQLDEKRDRRATHSLQLSEVPVVTVDGVAYREFVLDVNQYRRSSRLSLDEVRIYTDESPDLHGYNRRTRTLDGNRPVFDLDAGRDVSVLLDGRLNGGRGRGDMALLVPDAAFANAAPTDSVYLYSKMGGRWGARANGGHEEWSVDTTLDAPPPAVPGSISGTVWVDRDENGIRDVNDEGIGGVAITLHGVNDLGETVYLETITTAGDGSYSFGNLPNGTYTLTQTQPEDYVDGADFVGSLGGEWADPDAFTGIQVSANSAGIAYDFSEYLDVTQS